MLSQRPPEGTPATQGRTTGRTQKKRVGRTRRVVEGLAASWVSFAVKAGVRLLVTPFYLSRLGGDLLGFNSFIQGIIQYFQVMQLGVGPTVQAIVARDWHPGISEEDREAVRRKVRGGGQLQHALALVAVLLSLGLALVLESVAQGLPARYLFMAQVCTVLFGVAFALQLSSNVFSAALVGRQRIGENTLYGMGSALLAAGVGVVLVARGWLLYGIAVGAVASGVYLVVQVRWRSHRLGMGTGIFRLPIEWGALKEVFSVSGWVVLASIGGLLSFQSARVVLGIIPYLGMAAVNKFSLLVAVPQLLRIQANRLAVVSRPGLTQMVQNSGERERTRQVALLMVKAMGLVAATLASGILLLNGRFVPLWVGVEFYAGDISNVLVAILTGLIVWQFSFKVLLEVLFRFKYRAFVFLAEGVLVAALSLVLAPHWGIAGVLAAGIIGELCVVFPFSTVPMLRWLSGGDGQGTVAFFSVVWVPFGIVAAASFLFAHNTLPTQMGWPYLFFFAFLIAGVCGVLGLAWFGSELSTYAPWPGRARR
jgi:O-antigen/teichoic acid export membrane protein